MDTIPLDRVIGVYILINNRGKYRFGTSIQTLKPEFLNILNLPLKRWHQEKLTFQMKFFFNRHFHHSCSPLLPGYLIFSYWTAPSLI